MKKLMTAALVLLLSGSAAYAAAPDAVKHALAACGLVGCDKPDCPMNQ